MLYIYYIYIYIKANKLELLNFEKEEQNWRMLTFFSCLGNYFFYFYSKIIRDSG